MGNPKNTIASDYNKKADSHTQRTKRWLLVRRGMGRGHTEGEGWEVQTITYKIKYKAMLYSTGNITSIL